MINYHIIYKVTHILLTHSDTTFTITLSVLMYRHHEQRARYMDGKYLLLVFSPMSLIIPLLVSQVTTTDKSQAPGDLIAMLHKL